MIGMWITCEYCNRETLAMTSLAENGICFECYMKGYGIGSFTEAYHA